MLPALADDDKKNIDKDDDKVNDKSVKIHSLSANMLNYDGGRHHTLT